MNKIFILLISLVLISCNKSPDWKIYHQVGGQTILVDEISIII